MYAAPSDSARAIATATSTIVTRDVPVETVGGAADSTTVRALGDVVGMPFASDSRAVGQRLELPLEGRQLDVLLGRPVRLGQQREDLVLGGLDPGVELREPLPLGRLDGLVAGRGAVEHLLGDRVGELRGLVGVRVADEDLQQHPLVRHLGGDALRELDRIHRALEAEVGDGGLEHGAGRHQLRVRLGDGLGREDAGVAEARVVERLADVQGRPRFERPRQLRGDRDGDDDGEDQRERDQPGRRPERGGITA